MNFQLKKIQPDGSAGPWLTDYRSITVSDVWNEIPSIKFTYADSGAHRSTHLTSANFNELALCYGGTELLNGRFIVDEQEWDLLEPDERSYHGPGIIALMDWTKLWLELAEGDSKVYTLQTPGAIMLDLINRFNTLWSGVINPPKRWDHGFVNSSSDANLAPWDSTTTMTLARGYSLLQLISDLQGNGQLFVRFFQRSFQPYRDDYGIDRTIGPSQVLLQRGRDIVSAKVKQTAHSLVSATGGKTGSNLSRWWVPAAFTRDGMVREEYLPDSNTGDVASRDAALTLLLDRRADCQRQYDIEIVIEKAAKIPWKDYQAGDWIWADLGGDIGRIRMKVMQITLDISDSGKPERASIVGNDFIDTIHRTIQRNARELRFGRLKLPA